MVLNFKRAIPAWIVAILAFLTIVASIMLIVGGAYFQTSRFYQSEGALFNWSDSTFKMLLIPALLAIVVSVMGLFANKIEHRGWFVVYGALLLFIWIILFLGLQKVSPLLNDSRIEQSLHCSQESQPRWIATNETDEYTKVLHEYQHVADNILIPAATKWMCSRQCPCKREDVTVWLDKGFDFLKTYDRTTDMRDKNDTDGTISLFAPADPNTEATDYYEAPTFFDCWFDWERDWKSENITNGVKGATPFGWSIDAQADFEALEPYVGYFEFVEYMEINHRCNGACSKGLFYFSQPPAEGIPEESCLTHVANETYEIGSLLKNGFTLVVVIGAINWIAQFSLWVRYKE